MNFPLNRQIADDLMKIEGEMRGVVLKTDEQFILNRGGGEKLKEVEKEIKDLGYSLKYDEIDNLSFYPIGLRALSLLAITKVFDMNEGQIKEMGSLAPKTSLVVKFFIQYFLSVKSVFAKVSDIWERHYMIGKLVPVEINEKKKFVVVRLEEFNIHPILCVYLSGYFLKISEMAIKSKVTIEEDECFFKSGKCHEFLIKW